MDNVKTLVYRVFEQFLQHVDQHSLLS